LLPYLNSTCRSILITAWLTGLVMDKNRDHDNQSQKYFLESMHTAIACDMLI
jgi:hypothetical protein